MTVSIHQPNFIPWIGYFYKISQSDIFVMLDDVQYTKNCFINRNKIKLSGGGNWVTLPVVSVKLSQKINETLYFEKCNNVKKIKKTIELNYRKASFFEEFYGPFAHCLDFKPDIVSEFNSHLLLWLMDQFGINTKVVSASAVSDVEGTSTERLVSICKSLGGNTYLSGAGGANYQDDELYSASAINLSYVNFKHPVYKQLHGDFLPYMSAIDYLFNCGPATRDFFKISTVTKE